MSIEELEFRPYRPEDFASMAALLDACELYDTRRDRPEVFHGILRSRPAGIQVAAKAGFGIVGCGACVDLGHPEVGHVATHEDYRNQGIASRIIERLAAVLADEGFDYVELLVNANNTHLQEFYQKRGFRPTDACVLMEREQPAADTRTLRRQFIADPLLQAFDVIYSAEATSRWPHRQPVGFLRNLVQYPYQDNGLITTDVVQVPALYRGQEVRSWGRLRPGQGDTPVMRVLRTVEQTGESAAGRGYYIVERDAKVSVVDAAGNSHKPIPNIAYPFIAKTILFDLVNDAYVVSKRQSW